MSGNLICPKCKSNNVIVQAVGITRTKNKGCLYWLFIGWWLELLLWFFTFGLMLIVKLFRSRKIETKVESHAICQNCGNVRKIQ